MPTLTDDVAARLCQQLEEEEFQGLWGAVEHIMRMSSYERQAWFVQEWVRTPRQLRKQLLQQIILHDSK